MKIRSIKALTMVELLVALVISSVLLLMVGALSNIAFSSHAQLKKEGDVYSDLFYGLSRISFLARKATVLKPDNVWPHQSGSNTLFVDYKDDPDDPDSDVYQCAFGLYSDGENMKLVFIPDRTKSPNQIERENILEKIDITPLPSFVVTQIGQSVSIDIQGTKNKEAFNVSHFVVKRRNN